MRRNYLILTTNELREYLKGKSDIDNTKDYELAAALLLIRFHNKETGERLKIALPIKEPVEADENLVDVFRKKIDENHDIDIYLIPENVDLSDKKKHKVSAIQLKRFFLRDQNSGKQLFQYLIKEIPKKYPNKGDGILTLIFREKGSFSKEDFEKINSALNSIESYPFGRVMFVAGDSKLITLGELTNKWGHKSYTPEEWFSE